MKKRKEGAFLIHWVWVVVIPLLLLGAMLYWYIFGKNVSIPPGEGRSFYIYTADTYQDVLHRLDSLGFLKNPEVFDRLAERKNLPAHIYPGHYLLADGMSHNALINMLRSGSQVPVMVTFINYRTLEELAGKFARQLEPDSAELAKYFLQEGVPEEYGFTWETFPAMFIPNTYEFFWNATPESIVRRMKQEYERFWNDERKRKAASVGLKPVEVATLASIIDEETRFDVEKPTIAGVYINRLERGIPLQADPTIKFALGDYSKNRILTRDLLVNSPYNTYRNRGLPPGPIRIPSIVAMEAVLDHEEHDYLYFCARDDFSGYHHFSRTLEEHNRYAASYRRALNQQRIYR